MHASRALLRRLRETLGFVPTRRFALVVGCVAPLWLLGFLPGASIVAVSACVLVAAAVAVDVASLPNSADVGITRTFPDTVGVGDSVDGVLTLQSYWHRPLVAHLFDALPPKFLTGAHLFPTLVLPAGESVEQTFSVQGAFRGSSALGDLAVRITTRLGLASRTFRYPQTDRVLVAPSLAGVKRFRWLAVHHRLATSGVRATRRRGEGSSFSRLRDYVVGDDPRYIDWKATARRGHPITREFTIEQSQTVFVLVDAGRTMTQIAGAFPRFEYALAATVLLADVAITAGDRVGAMVFDDELRAFVPAQRGLVALQALRQALVPVQATLVEPDYSAAFNVLAQRQRKRALIVLITDVVDARVARSLLAHLSRGGARHLAVVVALRNETLSRAAAKLGSRVSELYASGAAQELLSDRMTALQRMRDAGVVVLDVAPDAMAAAVVNQYLELKSRGAL